MTRRRWLLWGAIGVACATALSLTALLVHHGDLLCFVNLSPRFSLGDPRAPGGGYDGQFAYFIAREPMSAVPQLDVPAYRWQRVLYPMLARLVSFGHAEWVPFALVAVNVIAVGIGTGALARLMKVEQAPAWLPIMFFAWFGTGQALLYDLNEITALAFSLVALWLFFRGQVIEAGLVFGLGALAKDLVFLFAVPCAVHLFVTRRSRQSLGLSILAIGPYLLWMLALRIALGRWSFDAQATQFTVIPFSGIQGSGPATAFVIALLILPGFVCLFLAFKHWRDVYSLSVMSSFAFVTFLPSYSYSADAVFRLSTPLVLAGALLLARFRRRTWLILFASLWSATGVLSVLVATGR